MNTASFCVLQELGTEKLQALQEPGAGEGVYPGGDHQEGSWEKEAKPLLPAVFPQYSLLIKLVIRPAGKAKLLKGHRSIFTEQAKLLNLEVRFNKSITGRVT